MKDDVEEDEKAEKVAIDEDGEDAKGPKKISLQTKGNLDSVKEENGAETKSNNNDLKSVGFRKNGSRRKN